MILKNNWRQILSWEVPQNVSIILPVWVSDKGYVDREEADAVDVPKINNVLYPKLKNRFLTTIKRILGKDANLVKADLDTMFDWDADSEIIMFEGQVEGPKNLIKKLLVTPNSVWPTGNNRQAEEEIKDALKEQAIYEK